MKIARELHVVHMCLATAPFSCVLVLLMSLQMNVYWSCCSVSPFPVVKRMHLWSRAQIIKSNGASRPRSNTGTHGPSSTQNRNWPLAPQGSRLACSGLPTN